VPDYMTKGEIAAELADRGHGGKVQIRRMLDGLAELAEEKLSEGSDFLVPGIVKISYKYRKPQKKGERWKKGETVIGFGGVESVKEEDSPPVKAQIKLMPSLTGIVYRLKPSTKSEAQAAFIKSKAGKNIIKRKG
jgi:nucleoid DNA-binding protein